MIENPIKFFIQNDFSQIQDAEVVGSLQENMVLHGLYTVLPVENRCEDISTADILVTLYWRAMYHGTYTNMWRAFQAFCVMSISIPRRNKILFKTRFTGKPPPKQYYALKQSIDVRDLLTSAIQKKIVWGEFPFQAIIQTLAGKVREILAYPPRLDRAPVRSTGQTPTAIWKKAWWGPVLTILGGCASLIGLPLLIGLILEGIQKPNLDDPYEFYIVVCCCPLPIVLMGMAMLAGGALYWRKTRKANLSPP